MAFTVSPPPLCHRAQWGDPISEKKLAQLEGQWDHVHEILGWIMDGKRHTIALPPQKSGKSKSSAEENAQEAMGTAERISKISGHPP